MSSLTVGKQIWSQSKLVVIGWTFKIRARMVPGSTEQEMNFLFLWPFVSFLYSWPVQRGPADPRAAPQQDPRKLLHTESHHTSLSFVSGNKDDSTGMNRRLPECRKQRVECLKAANQTSLHFRAIDVMLRSTVDLVLKMSSSQRLYLKI